MREPLYIAVDLGAGSGRVFAAGLSANELLLHEVRRFQYLPVRRNGHLGWHAAKIISEIKTGLREASEWAHRNGRTVASIGVDGWGTDYGFIDADGRLCEDPVCYRDNRTQSAVPRVFEVVRREEIYDFQFNDRRRGQTESAFISDMLRAKGLTASVGLRFDRYQLIQDEKSWSPRLSVAYDLPRAGIVLRGSYDRVFQIPAVENILLASSDVVSRLGGEGAFLPLRPSRGNYFETGFSKSVAGRVRLDGGWYRRHFDNFADDSLLLNTGVSFPIAFSEADIRGFEVKVDVPGAGLISGYASYSNMVGVGRLPVAGGLFLGDDAGELTDGDDSFAITQDQRNTLRCNVRLQLHPRLWVASTVDYNSGLPFEIEGVTNPDFIAQQYGPRLLGRVNFERGRVRPSTTISAAAGLQLRQIDRTRVSLQAEAFNLANRLNLINFSGVFSGTALAAPRHYSLRLRVEF